MKRAISAVLLALFLVACPGNPPPATTPPGTEANQVRESIKAGLVATTLAYDATMTALGELYKLGYLDNEQRRRYEAAANLYRGGARVVSLYVEGHAPMDWEAFATISAAVKDLQAILKEGKQP